MERSFWQKEERHIFDAYGRELAEARAQVLAASACAASFAAASSACDDVDYDPGNADADWAGIVKKRGRKVHFPLTQKSVLIAHHLAGLTDASSSSSSSSLTSSRQRAPASRGHNTTSFVIGGVDAPVPSNWATSYQAQVEGTPTPEEMMDPLRLRSKKKAGVQQQELQELQRGGTEMESHATTSARQGGDEEVNDRNTLIGYRAPPIFRGKASFLVGIGKKLHKEQSLIERKNH